MRSLFMCLILLAAPLFADKITTIEDKSFEGIVTAFDKDKKLTLATGYGDLSFTVATEVKDAAVADYAWPKTASTKKPARDAKFDTWVKDRDAAKKAAQPKAGEWTEISAKKAEGETDIGTVENDIESYRKLVNAGASAKERADARKKLFDGKWVYACFRVSETKAARTGELRIQLETQAFDPRTGKGTKLQVLGIYNAFAKEAFSAEDVDAANETALDNMRKNVSWDWCIDYSKAETLKGGDGIIFKLTFEMPDDSTDPKWTISPTRLTPKAKPSGK